MMKKHNFGAGPCILPPSVFEKAAESVLNFEESGLSILEISHRSEAFVSVFESARSLVLELMELSPNSHTVLFLHGGASLQFSMVPENFLTRAAAYSDTGVWSQKAIEEAKKVGIVDILYDGSIDGYKKTPDLKLLKESLQSGHDYLHLTTNNTIYGTQYPSFESFPKPLVVDMSSDIFSCQRSYETFDLIYAGAQKNIGPAGTTLVVIKNEFLEQLSPRIKFSLLDYQKHIKAESMYNTPSVFAVYTSLLNLKWLKAQGLSEIARRNSEKATLLYEAIDHSDLFEGFADKKNRSQMNITFTIANSSVAKRFESLCEEAGIVGIKGHRLVGGYRASMYNALSKESVETLVEVIKYTESNA